MDVVDSKTRSRMMAGIRAKNTAPEMVIRKLLYGAGYRYRLHGGNLPGRPDIVMKGRRIAIFVHGCFWHSHEGCCLYKRPQGNREFWQKKLDANVERDKIAVEELVSSGWSVIVVWECTTRLKPLLIRLPAELQTALASKGDHFQIPRQPIPAQTRL